MPVPSFDDRGWPLLRVTYAETMSADEGERFYARLATYLARRERFAILLDARLAEVPTAAERARIATFLESTAAPFASNVCGAAMVMSTAVGRGVLTAVLWLYTPPFAMRAFSTVDEAEQWLRAQLADLTRR